jgi:hypothetical protein
VLLAGSRVGSAANGRRRILRLAIASGASLSLTFGAAASAEPPPTDPPPVYLLSKAGRQLSRDGDSCTKVQLGDGIGVAGCWTAEDPDPRRVTVVRPRDAVAITMVGAIELTGMVAVRPLWREKSLVGRFRLTGPRTRVIIPFRRGAYELEYVVSRYLSSDGRSGFVKGLSGFSSIARADGPSSPSQRRDGAHPRSRGFSALRRDAPKRYSSLAVAGLRPATVA